MERPARVRPARPGDLPAVQHVGVDAGRMFATVDDPVVAACADDAPLDLARLAGWQAAGRMWVATDAEQVVGFVVVDVLDGHAHIEEVSVARSHGRRGIGRALVDVVLGHAADRQLAGVTLTTFRDVRWNAPWYRAQGFGELAEHELGPQLRARRDQEAAAGLDPDRRVCMRRAVR